MTNPVKIFYRVCIHLVRKPAGTVGCPPLYSCRTLNGRPHKKPPMGSRSAVLNADFWEPAAVAKEKGAVHSFMMFRIRFNLLGGCFACNCSAAVFNRSCRIGSGIHFRAAVWLVYLYCRTRKNVSQPGFPWLLPQALTDSKKETSREPMGALCGAGLLRPARISRGKWSRTKRTDWYRHFNLNIFFGMCIGSL